MTFDVGWGPRIGIGVIALVVAFAVDRLAGRRGGGSLAGLPVGADPCGERGEFHTFCVAGPMFAREIAVRVGETVCRDGFCFTDLAPAS